MRFLLSRRWLLFAVAVGLLTWLAIALGQWQFGRLEDRQDSNVVLERNLTASPLPVADVMRPGEQPAVDDEWRRVTVRGTWADEDSIVVRYRTRDGASGIDVVTPLRTDDGTAVLVDRGWMRTANSGAQRPDLPKATPGRVTVTGWVRRDATGAATTVEDASTRAISSVEIGRTLDYPVVGGFLDLWEQVPETTDDLERIELPEISEGPHFFYGLQWWFFGALAVFGFGYLLFDEWRRRRMEASEGPQLAPVDREHDAGDE
ncbi:SURF1 family protein [Alteromonas gracilis]